MGKVIKETGAEVDQDYNVHSLDNNLWTTKATQSSICLIFPTDSPHNKINIKCRQHQKAVTVYNKSATSPSLGFAQFIAFPFWKNHD